MNKSTEMLMNELQESVDIEKFVAENQEELMVKTLAEYLQQLLEQYGLKKSEVFKRAGMMEGSYGFDLFLGNKKNPNRDVLLRICLGFPLTIEETQKVLRFGGVSPLHPRNERDVYILFALKNKLNMSQLNDLLFDNGMEEDTFQ